MRYVDIVGPTATSIPQHILVEGFLDNISRAIGNAATKKITTVTNTATALQVIYKAASTPQYLETVTFLLKKSIKTKLKLLPDGPVKKAIIRMFPQGRELIDFLKGMCLICVVNARLKMVGYAASQGADQVADVAKNAATALAQKIVSLDSLLQGATSGTGIFAVMKALEVGNDILFELLTRINQKIAAA